jgi:hypothetical protein
MSAFSFARHLADIGDPKRIPAQNRDINPPTDSIYVSHKRWLRNDFMEKDTISAGFVSLHFGTINVLVGGQALYDVDRYIRDQNDWVILGMREATIYDLMAIAQEFYDIMQPLKVPLQFYFLDCLENHWKVTHSPMMSKQRRAAHEMTTLIGNLLTTLSHFDAIYLTSGIPNQAWFTQDKYDSLVQYNPESLSHFAECIARVNQTINDSNRLQHFGNSTLTTAHMLEGIQDTKELPISSSLAELQNPEFQNIIMDADILHRKYVGINPTHFNTPGASYSFWGYTVLMKELLTKRDNRCRVAKWWYLNPNSRPTLRLENNLPRGIYEEKGQNPSLFKTKQVTKMMENLGEKRHKKKADPKFARVTRSQIYKATQTPFLPCPKHPNVQVENPDP